MRAIVVGAGDVGYDVARLLSLQRHDVTVVDTDPKKVEQVRETLDVLAVLGSGTSALALREARIEDADLLVAVTDIDEVNLIASMLAERVGKSSDETTTIARVRSDEFSGDRLRPHAGRLRDRPHHPPRAVDGQRGRLAAPAGRGDRHRRVLRVRASSSSACGSSGTRRSPA